jgi:tetratricopeptide (TPR) repeat protein
MNPRADGEAAGPELDRHLQRMREEADHALPGFDARFHNRAGDLCVEYGQGTRALECYDRSIDAYLEAGRHNAAAAVVRKLLRIAPDAVRARCTLAWLSIGRDRLDDARREIDDYVDAATATGRGHLAGSHLRMMGRLSPDLAFREFVAERLRRVGDDEGARTLEDEPLQHPPDPAERWSRVLDAARSGAPADP